MTEPKENVMKVVKVTIAGDIKLFIKFDELDNFDAYIADIHKLEGIEMTEKDYNNIPISNQSHIFFKHTLKA